MSIKPDLVHAMRIPFEGMLAAEALHDLDIPLLTSVWGNDFTLWASENPLIAAITRRAMKRTNALHTDCHRDHRLAHRYGFTSDKLNIVVPGSGGVQMDVFRDEPIAQAVYDQWGLTPDRPVMFNPRNFRPKYVRNDVFFLAAERVLAIRPEVQVVCVGMSGNPVAERWRAALATPASVRLLPSVTRSQMAELFRIADISVSPSTHDGTPNTLLEAMACGTFPVVGEVESIREWIEEGINGAFCQPGDPDSVAAAMIKGLDPELRKRAAIHNRHLIEQRADFKKVMPQAERFYAQLIAAERVPRAVASAASHRQSPSGGAFREA
jgi:glycosyltransferase involved in cell wall biosynthesis